MLQKAKLYALSHEDYIDIKGQVDNSRKRESVFNDGDERTLITEVWEEKIQN